MFLYSLQMKQSILFVESKMFTDSYDRELLQKLFRKYIIREILIARYEL